jgi:hypothetical protein
MTGSYGRKYKTPIAHLRSEIYHPWKLEWKKKVWSFFLYKKPWKFQDIHRSISEKKFAFPLHSYELGVFDVYIYA